MTTRAGRRRGEPVDRPGLGLGPFTVFLLSVAAMFALASVLSGCLGEFWSMAAFLPLWIVLYLLIRMGHVFLEAYHDRA